MASHLNMLHQGSMLERKYSFLSDLAISSHTFFWIWRCGCALLLVDLLVCPLSKGNP